MVMVVVVVKMTMLAVVPTVTQMTMVTDVFMLMERAARTVSMTMLGLVMQMTVPIMIARPMVYVGLTHGDDDDDDLVGDDGDEDDLDGDDVDIDAHYDGAKNAGGDDGDNDDG